MTQPTLSSPSLNSSPEATERLQRALAAYAALMQAWQSLLDRAIASLERSESPKRLREHLDSCFHHHRAISSRLKTAPSDTLRLPDLLSCSSEIEQAVVRNALAAAFGALETVAPLNIDELTCAARLSAVLLPPLSAVERVPRLEPEQEGDIPTEADNSEIVCIVQLQRGDFARYPDVADSEWLSVDAVAVEGENAAVLFGTGFGRWRRTLLWCGHPQQEIARRPPLSPLDPSEF
ncbi:hypothetical protein [Lusitaniella coriacea]|uniref:hypothetical protein n=1 Tax=Lusitaniella coriacea TaxID=1983105 RepID=UPI003CEE903E